MADDPRYRTKYYLEYYVNGSKMTNTDNAKFGWIAAYGHPDYPLHLVFNRTSLVYCIKQASSKPLMDALTEAPYGYEESVPIEIIAAGKLGFSATEAMWKAEAEMRRVLETYPTGSNRSIEQTRPATQILGSTTLWSAEYIWNYRRDTT